MICNICYGSHIQQNIYQQDTLLLIFTELKALRKMLPFVWQQFVSVVDAWLKEKIINIIILPRVWHGCTSSPTTVKVYIDERRQKVKYPADAILTATFQCSDCYTVYIYPQLQGHGNKFVVRRKRCR